MPPEERSLRDLCERDVNGKKRYERVFKRWSSEERFLRALCHLEVTCKKRSERVFKRWSSEERSLRALCHLEVTCKKDLNAFLNVGQVNTIGRNELRFMMLR